MLVWRCYGLVVIGILFAVGIIIQLGLDTIFYNGYYTANHWTFTFVLIIAAAIVWLVGKKLNSDEGRAVIDVKTNERLILKRTHSFFWINVEYGAFIFLAIVTGSLYAR